MATHCSCHPVLTDAGLAHHEDCVAGAKLDTSKQLYQVLDRFGRVVYARCGKGYAAWRAGMIGGTLEVYDPKNPKG